MTWTSGWGGWPIGSPWPPQVGQQGPAVPVAHDPLTEHRMDIAALKERASIHGEEIDALAERVETLEKLRDAVRRYLFSLATSLLALLAHWQHDPLAKQASGIVEKLLLILK